MVEGSIGEQRSSARYMPLIRTAKIVSPAGEFLCIVRDASANGASIRVFHDIPSGERVTIELQNGDRHEMVRIWDEGDRQGYQFTAPVDVERLLCASGSHPKRPIRLNVEFEAEVRCLTGNSLITVRNISQQGASIECTKLLSIGQRVRVSGKHLPEIRANVRWREGRTYGLVFDDTFQFAELARTMARAQGIDSFFDAA